MPPQSLSFLDGRDVDTKRRYSETSIDRAPKPVGQGPRPVLAALFAAIVANIVFVGIAGWLSLSKETTLQLSLAAAMFSAVFAFYWARRRRKVWTDRHRSLDRQTRHDLGFD